MSEMVRRNQAASKKKIKALEKQQTAPRGTPGPRFRNTPGGRRLTALKAKQQQDADQ